MRLHTKTLLTIIWLITTLSAGQSEGAAASIAERAMSEFRQEHYGLAQQLFEKLVKSEPENARANYYLALVYLKQRKTEKAKEVFEQIKHLFPETDEARYSDQYLTNMTTNAQSANAKPAKVEANVPASMPVDARVERDLADAMAEAEKIKASAKSRADSYIKQAEQMANEMREVLAGRRYARRAYSEDEINAATADLRKQAQSIKDTGAKEAEDVINRAKARYESQTRH